MGLLEGIRTFFTLEPLQERTHIVDYEPGSPEDIFRRRYGHSTSGETWRYASVREALSVPSVFGIVSSIANTVGSLSVNGYRNGELADPEDRPRLIVRPDPFTTPGQFFGDAAYNLASRGEAWWWIAKRDPMDGSAMSLLNMAPQEVVIEETRDPLRPTILWRGQKMPFDDVRQIVYTREPGDRRGRGPLQVCGAAISVAVESQRWAANFYGEGGHPSTLIKHAGELSPTLDEHGYNEADRLRNQWIDRPNNVPRVIDQNIDDVKYMDPNPSGSQMLSSRDFQVGEMARAFVYPMSLIGYGVSGSSLTYQNVGQELDKLTRVCLIPNYLEKMEQVLTDLLPRSWQCSFDVNGLKRADEKARWEVYEIATRVIGPEAAAELARKSEGLEPGSVENAPVPFSPPSAVPTSIPLAARSLVDLRCRGCGKLAGRVSGRAEIKCTRCGEMVAA